MALKIPKEDTGSIANIKALPSGSMNKLISALRAAEPIPDPQQMAERIAKQVPSIPVDHLTSMLGTLYTLYQIREFSGVERSRFFEDLMSGIREIPDLKFTPKEIAAFRSVLDQLMSVDALDVVAKALRLQRDGERLYCTSKILSDVRPVFGPDPTARPVGAVLTHTLKIGYHEGREHLEFYVILETSDLEDLEEVVARARAKDRTLREFLTDAKVPNLAE
jgi:hypothetical protein